MLHNPVSVYTCVLVNLDSKKFSLFSMTTHVIEQKST